MRIYRTVSMTIITLLIGMAAHAEGLCTVEETAIFNCELEKSTSSFCQSNKNGALTYRNGSFERINLKISDNGGGGNVFYFSSVPYAGGGEAHIRFSHLGFTYYLYDKTVKADEGPEFSAGIVVYNGERKISNLSCNNDASIRERAYQYITREKFRSIDAR